MDIHVIIRPKHTTTPNGTKRAGTLQFNKWYGTELRAKGTATLWWKGQYIHCHSEEQTSVLKLEIQPTEISRLLHFGFSIEILQTNQPLFFGEWGRDVALNSGFTVQINLEKILKERNQIPPSCAVSVFTRQPGIKPVKYEVYHNQ